MNEQGRPAHIDRPTVIFGDNPISLALCGTDVVSHALVWVRAYAEAKTATYDQAYGEFSWASEQLSLIRKHLLTMGDISVSDARRAAMSLQFSWAMMYALADHLASAEARELAT